MSNTHNTPNTMYEQQCIHADLLSPILLSTTLDVPVPPSLTLPAFATRAFVRQGTPTRLVYVEQATMAVTLAGSDGPYWLAIHHDTHTPVTEWTRQAGSHYLWRSSATQPTTPDGAFIFASVTVSGGGVTALPPVPNPALNRVAYGGVNGQLSYAPQLYWDNVNTRLGIGTATPASSLHVQGTAHVSGGVGMGTVPVAGAALVTAGGYTQLAANVGIAIAPSYALDVNGVCYVRQYAGIGAVPSGSYALNAGSSNFVSVLTPSLTATNCSLTTVTVSSSLSTPSLSANAANITTLVVSNLGIGANPGGYALYSPSAGQCWIGGITGIGAAPNASYYLATPSAAITTLTAGNVTASGLAVGGGFQPGWAATVTTLYAAGNLHCAGTPTRPGGGPWVDSSSRAFKRHIAPIPDALTLLLAQQGRQFEWSEPLHAAVLPGTRYGLIAEEVTLSQWHTTLTDGSKAIAAQGFEALCIEAFRTIVNRIERLEERL